MRVLSGPRLAAGLMVGGLLVAVSCGSDSTGTEAVIGGSTVEATGDPPVSAEVDGGATPAREPTGTTGGAPDANGLILGLVLLDPTTQTGELLDLCHVENRRYEPESDPALGDTTAFVVMEDGTGALTSVPFLASQLSGGSMVRGPVTDFFDPDAPAPASRDAIVLPYLANAERLSIVVEDQVISAPVNGPGLSPYPACTGTTP